MITLRPFPVDPDDLPPYRSALRRALDGGHPIAPFLHGTDAPAETQVDRDVALVVSTSGSTGTPKRAMLTADNLRASADATHTRLGGPGQWLLPMPPQHIAGTQVIVRSIVAGTTPVTLGGFSTDRFVTATNELSHDRCYTSLVPTQLVRLLDAGPDAADALRRYTNILIGGAASAPVLLERARSQGVNVTTTYGMSETAGGCVYDGVPLEGTTIEFDEGRIVLRGPTVAKGYADDPERTQHAFDLDGKHRAFRTDDLGEIVDGKLTVLGRADDIINTGGMKVAPRVVEEAALHLEQVTEAVAVALPDDEWGQCVGLALVSRESLDTHQWRDALREHLPSHALPRRILHVTEIPLRGPGKPDRRALANSVEWQD